MEILVHVSAPSSARDDARYRAQVAAICAFEPVSHQLLIPDSRREVLALPAADAPEGTSLLPQEHELISAPSSGSCLSAQDATATLTGPENVDRQTSTDSPCDRDLKDRRRKKPPGSPSSAYAGSCPEVELATDAIVAPAITTSATPNANTISNPRPCPRRDLRQIFSSPETNHIRPGPLVPAPALVDQSHEPQRHVGVDDPPQPAPKSLGSVISVIPDSQPDLSTQITQSCSRITRSPSPLHEEDPTRSPKRPRVEARPAMGQTISATAVPGSSIASHAAHRTEKALPKDKSPSAPLMQSLHPLPGDPALHTHAPNSVSADPPLWSTRTRNVHHQHEPGPSSRDDSSVQHQRHFRLSESLRTLPLTLQPPPPPISTATFTTHITPTLAMLTERLKPTRTYKPTHQARELDKLERGYWMVHINIIPEPTPARAQQQEGELPMTKESSGSGSGTGIGASAGSVPTPNPKTWSEADFSRFWTFLSDFITKDARAGWGVWCILDRVESHQTKTNTDTYTNPMTTPDTFTADDSLVPVLLKVYAWGEVAMHIYLVLYLASDRRVRSMGLRWMDSWEKVVIQMP